MKLTAGDIMESRSLYRLMCEFLAKRGWERIEPGEGWWHQSEHSDEATVGEAVEAQFFAEGLDTRQEPRPPLLLPLDPTPAELRAAIEHVWDGGEVSCGEDPHYPLAVVRYVRGLGPDPTGGERAERAYFDVSAATRQLAPRGARTDF